MIPKIIHYCWFGHNPLPELAQKCISSWVNYFPEYEIKEWNEDNFDVNIIPYTAEAFKCKKYAFVSDYARFWILYHYGGLYFDTDVEVLKPMDDIITKGNFLGIEKQLSFVGQARKHRCNPGLGMGCVPGEVFVFDILEMYKSMHFLSKNGEMNQVTIVEYTSDLLYKKGLKNIDGIQYVSNFYVYPDEYFCPLSMDGVLNITNNSYSIHHYMASWSDDGFVGKYYKKAKMWFIKLLPDAIVLKILKMKKKRRDDRNLQNFNY